MSALVEILHNLLDSGEVVDSQVAHVSADGRRIEKSDGNLPSCQFMNQPHADLRGHDGNALNFVFHHSLRRQPGSARIIVGVAEDGVITKLSGADFKTLDYFREERVLDVGNDDAESATVSRSQMARMNVGNVSQTLDGRENQAARAASHLSSLVQDIGNSGGRD